MERSESPHLFSGSTLDSYTSGVWHASALLADRVKAVRQPYSGAAVADLQDQVDAVDLDRPLGDTRARTRTGASIVAIVRDEEVLASPGPAEILRANDVLVVIGTEDGIDGVEAIIVAG